MKTISLKIDNLIFEEIEEILSKLKKPRNRYINEAINHYNKNQKRKLIAEKLKKESDLVREESMKILMDFEEIDFVN